MMNTLIVLLVLLVYTSSSLIQKRSFFLSIIISFTASVFYVLPFVLQISDFQTADFTQFLRSVDASIFSLNRSYAYFSAISLNLLNFLFNINSLQFGYFQVFLIGFFTHLSFRKNSEYNTHPFWGLLILLLVVNPILNQYNGTRFILASSYIFFIFSLRTGKITKSLLCTFSAFIHIAPFLVSVTIYILSSFVELAALLPLRQIRRNRSNFFGFLSFSCLIFLLLVSFNAHNLLLSSFSALESTPLSWYSRYAGSNSDSYLVSDSFAYSTFMLSLYLFPVLLFCFHRLRRLFIYFDKSSFFKESSLIFGAIFFFISAALSIQFPMFFRISIFSGFIVSLFCYDSIISFSSFLRMFRYKHLFLFLYLSPLLAFRLYQIHRFSFSFY